MDAEAPRSQLVAALARVAAGDRAALRLVYQDTSAKLFGVCLRILSDRGEAEDVLQEVYVTVWRKAATFDPNRASPITWLVAIARNRAIDRLRATAVSRRMEPIEAADKVSDPAPAAVERVELAQQHQRLAGCLEELDQARPVETQGLSRSMSEDDTIGPADGGNLVAAEYVLGVLGAEERREVERRLAQEPALASEVAFWEARLGGLADAVPPVTPPPQAWSRIDAAISAPAAQPGSLWNSLEFWRAFGIGAGALAAASIAALTYIGVVPTPRPPLLATLGGSAGQPHFVAAVSGSNLVVVPAAL